MREKRDLAKLRGVLREEVEFELSQSIDIQESVQQREKESNPGRGYSVETGMGAALHSAHLENSKQGGLARVRDTCTEDRIRDHQKGRVSSAV